MYRTANGADDSGGQRAFEAERIANGEYLLADSNIVGLTEWQKWQRLFGSDLDQCKIILRVGGNHRSRVTRAFGFVP